VARIDYERLSLRNAYLYEACDLPLHKQGLVLIRGLNLDDGGFLGAGKSTLFDAFARVQFGKGGKQDTVADIMNPKVGKDLEITLRLRVDDHPYEIRQFRNHSQYGTALHVIDLTSGENILPLENRTHPQVWIRDNLLHTDETSFFNTAYLTQSHTHVLLHGKEAERRQRLTAMFGLDVYDQFSDQLRQLEKVSEGDLQYLEQAISRTGEVKRQLADLGDLDTLRSRLKKVVAKLEDSKHNLAASSQELDGLQEQLASVRLRANLEQDRTVAWDKAKSLHKLFTNADQIRSKGARRCQRSYEKLTSAKAQLESRLTAAKERGVLESQLVNLDEDLELAGDLDQVEADLLDAKTRLHHLNTIELPSAEKRHELGQQLAKLSSGGGDLTKVRDEHTDLVHKAQELEQEIRKSTKRLESGICSECKRPLDLTDTEVEQLRAGVKTLRSDLKLIRTQQYAKQNLLESLERRHELQQALDAIKTTRSVEEVDKEIAALLKTERKLSRLAELAKQRGVIEAKLSSLPVLTAEETPKRLAQLGEQLDSLRTQARAMTRIADLNRKIRRLPTGDHQELERAVKRLRANVRVLTSQIGRRSKKVADLENKRGTAETLQAEYKTLRRKAKEGTQIRERLACLNALRQAFGPKGIKQHRFHAILSDATENTIPAYSQLLWPNKQISLELEDDDGIKFYLKREGQKQLVQSNVLSGGEKHKAGLAFLLGLRDLKEVYTGSTFNVLVVDEPFGNLDPQGEQAFLSILEMLKERFGSIFIISHRPEVLGSSVWDQTWWVIRKNHSSKLYTGDPPTRYLKLAETFMTTDGD
jgi:DNA repair exonuclease SbcCD ATPase subunit